MCKKLYRMVVEKKRLYDLYNKIFNCKVDDITLFHIVWKQYRMLRYHYNE